MKISYANVVATMALVLAVGGTAFAASGSGSAAPATLKLCAAKKNGDLRLLSTGGGACRSSERSVVVDRQGIKGAAGATGAAGPQGAQGERGAQGPQGERGPAGPGTVLTSPDGRFSVAATNDGIVLAGPKGSATFDGQALRAANSLIIDAPANLVVSTGNALSITAGSATSLTTGTTFQQDVGAGFAQNVGGAFSQTIGASYDQSIGINATQNVGSAFAQNVGSAFAQTVGGAFSQSIGAAAVQEVAGNATVTVDGTSSLTATKVKQKANDTYESTSVHATSLTAASMSLIASPGCWKGQGGSQIANLC
jgi:hypothetical protein